MSTTERTATIDDGGRGGRVTYADASGTLTFVWEMASFGFDVSVPTAARWEDQTGLPLAIRSDTLSFIAERIIATRGTPTCTFKIVEGEYASLQIHLP